MTADGWQVKKMLRVFGKMYSYLWLVWHNPGYSIVFIWPEILSIRKVCPCLCSYTFWLLVSFVLWLLFRDSSVYIISLSEVK